MTELKLYAAVSRFGRLNYRLKIMVMAFLGTHVPLLAIIGFYLFSTSSDIGLVWATLAVALVATLIGTGITLLVLNGLLQPVLRTSEALRAYRRDRELRPLPEHFTDEVGTLMADAGATLSDLEASLKRLEHTDPITGLVNRARFVALAEKRLAGAQRYAMLALRIDNLDRVATTCDRQSADALLRTVAERLEARLEGDMLLGRVDGSTLALLRAVRAGEDIMALVAALTQSAAVPVTIGHGDIVPELCSGVALAPEDGDGAVELLDHAIAASALHGPGNVNFHSTAARQEARDRFALEQELRGALERQEFLLHFQPVVDPVAGRAVGAEALIRWQHPERGLVPPGLFIPAAERNGMIDEIGLWVMRETCRQIGAWDRAGLDPLKVAINVSGRQFVDPRFIELLHRAIRDNAISPERLEVELTETVAMADADHTRQVFGRLADLGVSIAIDDFGTGYASMSQLRALPFDKLKIDREFVSGVDGSRQSQAITRAMLALGRGLGLRLLAEGTERAEEVNWLTNEGCELFQGYYFARPVAAQQLPETLEDIRLMVATADAAPPLRQSA